IIILALQKQFSGFDLPKNPSGDIDYNMTLPLLLSKLYPNGILGVRITALIASFMSGMAGNVTAFNTVWTFDIYQAHINKNASEKHYLYIGKVTTVVGILISIATAYVARGFNSIMDLLQLVFSFVNAPLFATFFLGMFWKRTTGHGAFWGLVSGTLAATLHYELTAVAGPVASLFPKLAVIHAYPSDMAQNFWGAIWAWTMCFAMTAAVSLMTRPKAARELEGVFYGLTPRISSGELPYYRRPATLALVVLAMTAALNLLFW